MTFLLAIVLQLAGSSTPSRPISHIVNGPAPMTDTLTAAGTFEVKLAPLGTHHQQSDLLGRLSIDKTFAGDLAGTSRGEMLSALTTVDGSAGYVAMERVTGTLAGRSGSFVLQHSGTMDRGSQALSVTVVPDSGTEGLTGLTGRMTITIAGGKHLYEFKYSLPGQS